LKQYSSYALLGEANNQTGHLMAEKIKQGYIFL